MALCQGDVSLVFKLSLRSGGAIGESLWPERTRRDRERCGV